MTKAEKPVRHTPKIKPEDSTLSAAIPKVLIQGLKDKADKNRMTIRQAVIAAIERYISGMDEAFVLPQELRDIAQRMQRPVSAELQAAIRRHVASPPQVIEGPMPQELISKAISVLIADGRGE